MKNVYKGLIYRIDKYREEMSEISGKIHSYSELAFDEHKSSGLLIDTLVKYGFHVDRGAGLLDTAFKAVYPGKKGGKTIAFLAEYDALPGIGHGCGHNLIGASSVFAAIALSEELDEFQGNIVVMGTPAEETGGGKIILIDSGAFDDVDYSIMAHPSSVNEVGRRSRAITGIHIEYFGKSAHSSVPESGINALKAVINTFVGIDMISQSFPKGVSTNGIITDGGKADNIIPDYARCQFTVRAETRVDLLIVIDRIKGIISSSELLTGAKSKMHVEPIYAERYPNMTMELRYKEYMESLGEEVSIADPLGKYGSSDIGNVSLKMPVIHSYFKIMDEPVNSHSLEFTQRAVSERAFEGMLKSTKALAMLGADILLDESFREEIDKEFKMKKK